MLFWQFTEFQEKPAQTIGLESGMSGKCGLHLKFIDTFHQFLYDFPNTVKNLDKVLNTLHDEDGYSCIFYNLRL